MRAVVAAGVDLISPRLALVCAGAAAMVADDETAGPLFEKALADEVSRRWPFDRARIELAHGEWLRRRRAMTAARAHLDAALEVFDRLGARPWSERARAELRATRRSRQSVATTGSPALTPQEHEIALLAATGLSNRDIGERLSLSPRTIGAHLYRAFPTLGVTSRPASATRSTPCAAGRYQSSDC